MLFNSLSFLVFLPCVWLLYKASSHRRQNLLLLAASYVFYGWWDYRFLSLLGISTVVDYCCGMAMKKYRHRKRIFLIISISTNIGILGTFKYFDFFLNSATQILESLGWQAHLPVLGVILPVGISFYTFQTLAYSIDVYRGKQEPTRDLLSFALYVAYFPQLVAGPIERSTKLLPQIQRPRRVTRSDLVAGAELCVMGYFKKVFIADGVATIANELFANSDSQSGLALLIAVYLFALQIYGDFSGYSDIARGVSRLFGIRLCLNFRQPYLAANITDFWRRWHISLSTWLRDYLYIPLGGNRKGLVRTYINLFVTMLLGGLWHGAAWTFVVWGGLHGLYLSLHKLMLRGRRPEQARPPETFRTTLKWGLAVAATFNLVCLTWVFFRAQSITQAAHILTRILSFARGTFPTTAFAYLLFFGTLTVVLDLLCWFHDREVPFAPECPPILRGVIYGAITFLVVTIGESSAQPFIYFQF